MNVRLVRIMLVLMHIYTVFGHLSTFIMVVVTADSILRRKTNLPNIVQSFLQIFILQWGRCGNLELYCN